MSSQTRSQQRRAYQTSNSIKTGVKVYADYAEFLLENAGGTFQLADVDLPQKVMRRWKHCGVLIVVDRQIPNERTSKPANVYEVNRLAVRAAEDVLRSRDTLPCGHTGFRNLLGERDPGYSCANDECDARFYRETIEEVFGDE